MKSVTLGCTCAAASCRSSDWRKVWQRGWDSGYERYSTQMQLEFVLGFLLFSVCLHPWWNLPKIIVLNAIPALKTPNCISSTQISYVSSSLWDSDIFNSCINPNVPQVVFWTFSLHMTLPISGGIQTRLLISVATAYVQVAIVFNLDHSSYHPADLTASSLPLFRLFSPAQPEGTCLNEIRIKSLPCSVLHEGFLPDWSNEWPVGFRMTWTQTASQTSSCTFPLHPPTQACLWSPKHPGLPQPGGIRTGVSSAGSVRSSDLLKADSLISYSLLKCHLFSAVYTDQHVYDDEPSLHYSFIFLCVSLFYSLRSTCDYLTQTVICFLFVSLFYFPSLLVRMYVPWDQCV